MEFHKFENGPLGTIYLPKEAVDPQEWAMLAAWYSRSVNGVEAMVEKVSADSTTKFLDQFYISYGHESIGDLVEVKIFLEGIPLFLAPLIEHYALFRGQESSTRYIDISRQRLYGDDQGLLEAMRAEYLRALDIATDKLMTVNKPETASQVRAVEARAFDICRGLIPLGAVTNVAWYGDIRNIKGHLSWMLADHPWSQPWVVAIYEALKAVYPASMERCLEGIRPRHPWVFDDGDGKVVLDGLIDFGSWRDLNRHRVGRHVFRFPEQGDPIHEWYLKLLDQCGFRPDPELEKRVSDEFDLSHRVLGQAISFSYSMPESQADYFCWRRNQMDVHPTLRLQVQDLALRTGRETEFVPDVGLGYIERRGAQTILHRRDGARLVAA